MKTILKYLIIVVSVLISCKSSKITYESTESLFIGYEKIGILDESRRDYLWYYETFIKFKDDSVFIDQNPISTNKIDTLYSESDGGFYYYKGTKVENGNIIKIQTKQIACEFCPIEMKKNHDGKFEKVIREKNYDALKTFQDLKIGNQIFKKTQNRKLRSELYY